MKHGESFLSDVVLDDERNIGFGRTLTNHLGVDVIFTKGTEDLFKDFRGSLNVADEGKDRDPLPHMDGGKVPETILEGK